MTADQWTVELMLIAAWLVGGFGGWLLTRARYVRALRDWQQLAEQLDVECEQLHDEVEHLRAATRHPSARPLRAVRP